MFGYCSKIGGGYLKNSKIAIVTGAASGIGREVAKELMGLGIFVIGVDINKAFETNKSFICDVSDESQVISLFEKIKDIADKVDYLVNSAGMLSIGQPLPIKNMSIKQWDAIMRINLKSVLLMIKHSYPLMKNNSSSIVNISSEQVYNPDELFSPYTVSKAGVNMLTISAAKEFLNDGIRVNAIALGTVKTNILDGIITSKEKQASMFESKQNSIPFGIIDISNAAKVVIFLLSEDSKYITGEVVRCDGGLFLGR